MTAKTHFRLFGKHEVATVNLMSPRSSDTKSSALLATPTDSITVSFVVPALNEQRLIGCCLQSIQQLTRPADVRDIEVIVVDNGSTDRTADVCRELGADVVEMGPGNPAQARNAGARKATGQWLAFVDADCELARDWLAVCGAHFNNPQVVAVGGALARPELDCTWVERASFELANRTTRFSPQPVRWLPTFNLLIRRSAFDAVGGFDPSLSTCEDCDLGYRIAEVGRQVHESHAEVTHMGESRSLGAVFRREAWRAGGNVRLAMSRPLDCSNWLSLLFPPLVVSVVSATVTGSIIASAIQRSAVPWLVALAVVSLALVLLVFKRTKTANPLALGRQVVVFITYLAGRAVGLLWPARRVDR